MNVAVFGASGMIGGGVLRQCLDDARVESVLSIGRGATGSIQPKLRELRLPDLFDLSSAEGELRGIDACFYCVGVSSVGMSEDEYRRVTCDLTVVVADVVSRVAPEATFCFVSGQGTDRSSRVMWARVKAEAEDYLLDGPLDAYALRPGFVQPLRGARSRTLLYRLLYVGLVPISPILVRLFPGFVTTTVVVARAMIQVGMQGAEERVLETRDINRIGSGG